MVEKLRKIEEFVLQRLESNARSPFKSLDVRIKKKQQLISYTLNTLIKKDIIKSFYTLIDYSRFDSLNFRVYFKVNYITLEKYEKLIEFLAKSNYTSKVLSCTGKYDLICVFFAQNPSQFNKILHSIITKFPNQLQNYMILTTVVSHEFGKKYISNKNDLAKDIIIGGDRKPELFERKDLEILSLISDNSRMNSVEISSKVGLSPRTVINHIRDLEKRGIIKGYRSILDIRNIGFSSNLLLIKYHNISISTENELTAFLRQHRNVVNIVKVFGNWDLEIIIDTKNPLDYRKIEIEIRQKFTDLIKDTEYVQIHEVHKINYFPEYLLNE